MAVVATNVFHNPKYWTFSRQWLPELLVIVAITVLSSPSPIRLFHLQHLTGLDCHQVTVTSFQTYRVLHHSSVSPDVRGDYFRGWSWHPVPTSSELRSAPDWDRQPTDFWSYGTQHDLISRSSLLQAFAYLSSWLPSFADPPFCVTVTASSR